MQFANYADLTHELLEATCQAVAGKGEDWICSRRYSNQSCSAYLEVCFCADDGEEYWTKVRFSDHSDRHGSDASFNIRNIVREVLDEDGDYCHIVVHQVDFDEVVNAAIAFINDHINAEVTA
jgi:hypothetical protein